jgi:16S rRNA (guanine527-N7)-methyltransferase
VPEASRRRERRHRNGSEAFGHGRISDRSPLPRRPLPQSADGLPPLDDVFWKTVDEGLARLGLILSAAARAALDSHVRLLLAWNAEINLTALRNAEQIARGHVLDSLLAVDTLRPLADRGEGLSILDLGSGGGFPGLPLAIVLPARRAALVDSVGKKARFLAAAAEAVTESLRGAGEEPPEITALAERAEDLADDPDHREHWDLVVARAVGSVAEVAELGLPLVRRAGHVIAWKLDARDGALHDEVDAAARVIQAAGGKHPRIRRLEAADVLGLAGHCLVDIEKIRPAPLRYPRPATERRRSPLLS